MSGILHCARCNKPVPASSTTMLVCKPCWDAFVGQQQVERQAAAQMRLIDVEPTGTSGCIACGPAGCHVAEAPTYPDSPEGRALRRLRVAAGMSLGDLARHIGITVTDLSAIERGAKRPEDWRSVFGRAR